MAHGALSENERLYLDAGAKNQTERSQHAEKNNNGDSKSNGLRVRFLDEEGKIERTLNADEADYNIKKIHLLRIRSASETSLLLRRPSLMEKRLNERRLSDGQTEMNCINRKSTSDNINGRISLMKINENDIPNKTENVTDEAKDVSSQMFKKNCNVYSVNQAKTLTPEKKKIPLAIPKLIGNKMTQVDTGQVKSILPNEVFLADGPPGKDFTARAIGRLSKGLGRLFRRTNSVRISEPDPTYKVAYLGNVVTGWARGESCTEKPLATLWRNYQQSTKPDVVMKLSVTNSGLKGLTKEHGLTEYWAHRITYCASPPNYPKVFCWVYRHEGKKLKHELRCHAALCTKEIISKKIADELKVKVKQALLEFKKDRISKQNARMSLANSVYDNPSMPRRKIMLSVGAMNYRPPLERSKSAPKLGAIEELCSEEDEEEAEMESKQNLHDSWHLNNNSNSRTLDRRRPEMKSRKLSCPEGVLNRSLSDSSDEVQTSTNLIDMIVNSMESKLQTLDKITESCEMNDENDEQKEIKIISQSNFLVTDSDDGSVSSGCETASTVTSSDAEPTSLPSQFPQEEIQKERPESDEEKVSEIPDFNLGSMRNEATLYSNSIHFMNLEIDPSKSLDVVNHMPVGERNMFRRRSTYPPLGVDTSILGNLEDKFESLIDNLGDIERFESSTEMYKHAGDNDSACSDESGYSEFLDNGKESIIGNTIMV